MNGLFLELIENKISSKSLNSFQIKHFLHHGLINVELRGVVK